MVNQHFAPQDSQQALLMFTQAKQPHYRFYDSWMDPSNRLDNPPRVVVLHNTISSAYKEKKAKSLLPAFHLWSLTAHQWSMYCKETKLRIDVHNAPRLCSSYSSHLTAAYRLGVCLPNSKSYPTNVQVNV